MLETWRRLSVVPCSNVDCWLTTCSMRQSRFLALTTCPMPNSRAMSRTRSRLGGVTGTGVLIIMIVLRCTDQHRVEASLTRPITLQKRRQLTLALNGIFIVIIFLFSSILFTNYLTQRTDPSIKVDLSYTTPFRQEIPINGFCTQMDIDYSFQTPKAIYILSDSQYLTYLEENNLDTNLFMLWNSTTQGSFSVPFKLEYHSRLFIVITSPSPEVIHLVVTTSYLDILVIMTSLICIISCCLGIISLRKLKSWRNPGEYLNELLICIENDFRKALYTKPENERDVQDAFHSFLKVKGYSTFKREKDSVSFGNKVSVPDFTDSDHDLAVEIKFINDKNKISPAIEQISADLTSYSTRWKWIIIILYDVAGVISDPADYIDLNNTTSEYTSYVIVIKH